MLPTAAAPLAARAALALVLAALGLGAPRAAAAPTVILISLDGTHPRDLEATALAALSRMAREGARADRMLPVFPSNTFPNHVTLVTGVAPARHGIVNNVFVDPERGRYRYESDPTWLLSEPLWSIVEGAGIRTASFHWVGSEGPWRSGRGPTHWVSFDADTPASEKVARILAWLDLPPDERPRLVTAWFRGADHAAHRHGPGAPEVREALRRQDAGLARLLDGLAERGLARETTVLVVSDHGMMAVEAQVDLGDVLDDAGVEAAVHGGGGFATVTLADPDASRDAARAAARAAGLEAWAPGEAPADLGLDHPRFGHLAVLAPPGTALRTGLVARVRGLFLGGVHGYRPEHPAMAAVFLAWGRGVAPGARPGTVRALDVAPTILALLGVPIPAAMEGRPIELSATLGASKEDVEPARGGAGTERAERRMMRSRARPDVPTPRLLATIVALAQVTVVALALAAPAAAEDPETWHAETLSSSPRGVHVTQYWSKGPEKLRAETVVAGHRLVTLINGPLYHAVDATTGQVLTIRRSKRALARDREHSRPFATEGWVIRDRGGEKVREARLAGRMCDVWRLTDSRGRREVWVQQEPEGEMLPLRVEVYDRKVGAEIRTDYVQWASGLELPGRLFEPDPRFEVTTVGYDEYVERSAKGELQIAPVLHADLLHGPK